MKTGYKWELLRGGKKYTCPACGQKRFVPYVSTIDHETPADVERFGRCDREQNCGFNQYPSEEPTPNVEPRPLPPVDKIVFDQSVAAPLRSPLFDHAERLLGIEDARAVWHRYKIGASKDGRAVFWYIAADGEIRGGKMIKYKQDGHRDKEANPPALWAHAAREYAGRFKGRDLVQPLYGEHLLALQPDAPVAIVESEKTAAFFSAFCPRFVWLACGGSQGLKRPERLAVLNGRKVVLFPDNGQFYNWRRVANAYGWNITDIMERAYTFEGCDILDLIDTPEAAELFKIYEYEKAENTSVTDGQ